VSQYLSYNFLHFCGIFATAFCATIVVAVWTDTGGEWKGELKILGLGVFFLLGFVGFWIDYGVSARRSPEYAAVSNLMTLSEYEAYAANMRTAAPGVDFTAYEFEVSATKCEYTGVRALGAAKNDSTSLPTIPPGKGVVRRVSSTISVEWDSATVASNRIDGQNDHHICECRRNHQLWNRMGCESPRYR
jgi:hypothetical protein